MRWGASVRFAYGSYGPFLKSASEVVDFHEVSKVKQYGAKFDDQNRLVEYNPEKEIVSG